MNLLPLSPADVYGGNLVLVNQKYACPTEQNPLVSVGNHPNVLLQEEAASQLESLMKRLHGWDSIVPVSGWRSCQEQQAIWDQSIIENGLAFTQKYVALPGHSEHQTGLAIDLALKKADIDFICPDFPYTGICQAFRQLAPDYGFIERYPASKESITGISHEPWHFRYVGVPHAAIMTAEKMTLEEYAVFTKQFIYGKKAYTIQLNHSRVNISFLSLHDISNTTPKFDLRHLCNISGNNDDGFIVTEWR